MFKTLKVAAINFYNNFLSEVKQTKTTTITTANGETITKFVTEATSTGNQPNLSLNKRTSDTGDLASVIEKVRAKESVSLPEISLMMKELFSQANVTTTTHKFRDVIVKDCVFIVEEIRLVSNNPHSPPTDLLFNMKEAVFGINMEVKVSAKNFHEIFQPLTIKLEGKDQ